MTAFGEIPASRTEVGVNGGRNLDFAHFGSFRWELIGLSSGIGKGVHKPIEQGQGNFRHVRLGSRC